MYPEYDEILCQLDGLWNKFREKQRRLLYTKEVNEARYARIRTILDKLQEQMTWIDNLKEEFPE